MGRFYQDHRKLGESESEKEESGDAHALTDRDGESDEDGDDHEPMSTPVFAALLEISSSLGLEDEYLDLTNQTYILGYTRWFSIIFLFLVFLPT